jgi:hypothetical protein
MLLSRIAALLVLFAMFGLAPGQSGRVKNAPSKPTVAPVLVEKPETKPAAKKKDPDLPKTVNGERIYLGSEVDTKAVILKKPEPSLTREALYHSIHDKLVMYAILGANGRVSNIIVDRPLPYGLTKKGMEAALLIKFRPAMKDGEFVSEWVRVEYEFWLI